MSRTTEKIMRFAIGDPNPVVAGRRRAMRGFRDGDTREFYIGVGLLALSYLRRTKARRELIYRREIPEGAALMVYHKGEGQPRLEIVKPKKRRD